MALLLTEYEGALYLFSFCAGPWDSHQLLQWSRKFRDNSIKSPTAGKYL